MIMKLKQFGCLLTIIIILIGFVCMLNNAYAQEAEKFLEWRIETSKQTFYPGESVLLTISITNRGTQGEKVNFGTDGIEAFSFEIRDHSNIVMAKGESIQRFGLSRVGILSIAPDEIGQKKIVLNRWCSTLLPVGKYHIICNVDYRLRSESRKKEGSEVFRAGPIHKIQLELDIQIIEMDKIKFKEMLETLAGFEIKSEAQDKGKWLTERDTARELLAFTESELAVPYQLQLLKIDPYTWFGPDAVNSLVKSGTLEAAIGLVQIIEDPNVHKKDMNPIFIDGVYRLRETGKTEIITTTEDFVAKYKRPPVGLKLVD
ncbi:MAG TPA: hypothetical protein DDW84_04700 [Phycisphaerales bacterium]|nr:hypothetical protein [Phycisphaerales bacterium]HBR19068.1 hypothetical protein [Phycisphaerales bacterium]